jgi:hypothetical protein
LLYKLSFHKNRKYLIRGYLNIIKLFLQNIQNGVKHLQNMLTVQRNGSEWEGDQQAVDLANMGKILS